MAASSSLGCRRITRDKALFLEGYRHAVHAMLHSPLPKEMKLFGVYPVRHAVMLQLRHDGKIGFPGGFVDDEDQSLECALRRELREELGQGTSCLDISATDHLVSHVDPHQHLCLHFYCKKINLNLFKNIEKMVTEGDLYGLETQGIIRCPLYTMNNNMDGFPAFLKNNFIGIAREQLILGLKHEHILTSEEINTALEQSGTENSVNADI